MERKLLLHGETGVLWLVVHPVLWQNGFQLHLQFQVILLGDSLTSSYSSKHQMQKVLNTIC